MAEKIGTEKSGAKQSGLTRRGFMAASGTAGLAALLGSIGLPGLSYAATTDTLTIEMGNNSPRSLNPAVQSGVATALPGTQIFASPLRFDGNWNPQPYLAESWKMAPDGLSLTLDLVKGVTFHDGTPLTSEDVAFSVLAVQKYHPFKSMFAPVTGVDTPDPHTAVIRLKHPHPALLLCMSPDLLVILPKHVYGTGNLRTNPANLRPVGSGPYKFVDFKPGAFVRLVKNDKFFLPDRPKIANLVFKITADPESAVIGMERQQTQLGPFASNPRDLARLAKNKNLGITAKGYAGVGPLNWLEFNLLRKPLDDKRVRQAICYAIDKEFILKQLMLGFAERATGPIVPGSPFYSADVNPYHFDLAKANALLDAAGQKRGSNGMRFSLTVDYIPAADDQQRNIAEYLRPALKKVGIDVKVRAAPDFPTWAQRVANWDYDMTMDIVFNWGDPVIGVHRTYLSSNIRKGVIWSNQENYNNPKVDRLLAQAAQEMDEAKRKALYAEFQKIVVDDAPIAYINVIPYHTVYNKGLGHIPETIWGTMSPLDELYWEHAPT